MQNIQNRFVAIILARGGSKGIKLKNLIKINGKPLIYWTIKHCLNSKKISSVWVSSDNDKILNYSQKAGAQLIKRPKVFSKDTASSESAWLHAIKYLEEKKIYIQNIVGLQPTSPIRKKNDLDNAIKLFVKYKYDSLFTVQKIHAYFTWSKVKTKVVADYSYKFRKRRQETPAKFLENGSFYIFRKDKFLKHKNRLFGKLGIYEMSKIHSFEIDDFDDIKIISSLKRYF